MSDFYSNVLQGNRVKDLIRIMLETSGYTIYPYGYESTYSEIKKRLSDFGTKNTRTVRRIRSSPDLLIYDDEKELMLVEVKMRNAPRERDVILYDEVWRTQAYKDFWNDAIFVLVVPCGHIFYA